MMRILIIKTGHRETLCADSGGAISLGDVLRTTVLLHLFKNDDVTWFTDAAALPLLSGNLYITRVIIGLQAHKRYDLVINLERDFDASHINTTILINAPDYTGDFSTESWSDVLFKMLGRKYNGESHILGYRSKSSAVHDVGLNYKIGSKFPDKQWDKWDELFSKLIEHDFTVSMQPDESDLHDYMDWIASCHTIITNDSLGMHIALAMGKQVIALFGSTPAGAVCGDNLMRITAPGMSNISVDDVLLHL